MKRQLAVFSTLSIMTLLSWQTTQAASFNCQKATSQIDQTICQNKTLSGLDSRMAGLYRSLKLTPKLYFMQDKIRSEQRAWVKARNQGCQAVAEDKMATCLESHYQTRIEALKEIRTLFESETDIQTPQQCYRIRLDNLNYTNQKQDSCYEKTYLNRQDVKAFFGTNLDSIKGFEKAEVFNTNTMKKRPNCDQFEGKDDVRNQYLYDEDIAFVNDHVLSTEITQWFYEGGAHGIGSTSFTNLDRKTHAIIHWEDMVPDSQAFDDYVTDLVINTIADKTYLNMTSKASTRKDVNSFKKVSYFSIRHDGLFIQYPPYEIGPYAMGSPSLTIPLKTLKQYLPKRKFDYYFGKAKQTKLVEGCQ